ncbi:uncharacterized protein LOC127831172 [Dreissena polymorpha]|uniref:uncharacterized protein LOC127831172 n=1 Tax=Dreissena polymorpha TaxID=45954 RepID=UPI0022648D66|nr:uncharacterized protein LOC127831172 [Dreissena polymorpha]
MGKYTTRSQSSSEGLNTRSGQRHTNGGVGGSSAQSEGRKIFGLNNVPSELITHVGEATMAAMTALCQKIWKAKKWPKQCTQSLVTPLPKKGNLRLCKNYRTISHPSKVMLRLILNRLKSMVEELLAEEQAGFRAKCSTVEQVFNFN